MFTEDYLMRIINQAIAALMIAIGLRKSGKYLEAQQAIQQSIEQLTTLPANIVDEMDDVSILGMLTVQGHMDVDRLAILADLYQEQGEIFLGLDQPVQASPAFARALRFILEVALAEDANLSTENVGKVKALGQRLNAYPLPVETQLALSDYYGRLLEKDAPSLTNAGISRCQINEMLARLQNQTGPTQYKKGD
jgi:hypothetical protein